MYGLTYADRTFAVEGRQQFLNLLSRLPPGVTEVYLHPATEPGSVVGYPYQDDLAALLDAEVIRLIRNLGVQNIASQMTPIQVSPA